MSTKFGLVDQKAKELKNKKINGQKTNFVKTELRMAGVRDGESQEITPNKQNSQTKAEGVYQNMMKDEAGTRRQGLYHAGSLTR